MESLTDALWQVFHRAPTRRHNTALTLYDSFDWRLWHKGQLLLHEAAVFRLVDRRTNRLLAEGTAKPKRCPRFWWEWPISPLRDCLREVLDVRALIPWVALQNRVTLVNLLNPEEKTVVRLAIEAAAAKDASAGDQVLRVVKLIPVRGYRAEWLAAHAVLTAAGLKAGTDPLPIAVLRQRGLTPGAYAPKADIPLTTEMSAGAAAGTILKHLLGVMRQNEDGLRRDIDTEFLHDFRVAVRRARSLLALLQDVFAPEVRQTLQTDLRAAGKATNPQRDLDVYLLHQRHYEELVPESLRAGIRPLFASLRRRRSQACRRTTHFLDSQDYRRLGEHIETFAGRAPANPASPKQAGQPILPVANSVIAKCYRKIVKAGRRIDAATPDAELHRLRIACKKLRYALEFFATLYPAQEMKLLIKQLKALQDNLGRFNDLSVQQTFLHAYLGKIDLRKPQAVETAAATGALIGRLHLEHRQMRQSFESVFSAFDAPDNSDRYARLFTRYAGPA